MTKRFSDANILAALRDGITPNEIIEKARKYGAVPPILDVANMADSRYSVQPIEHIELAAYPDSVLANQRGTQNFLSATQQLRPLEDMVGLDEPVMRSIPGTEHMTVPTSAEVASAQRMHDQKGLNILRWDAEAEAQKKLLAEETARRLSAHNAAFEEKWGGAPIPKRLAAAVAEPKGMPAPKPEKATNLPKGTKASKLKGAAILTLAGMAAGSLGNQYMQPKPQYQDPLQ